ncbi:Pleiotropic drug resistance protein [Phytophthora palmivora]|uniref:Pleiotropic drug resistance protein n=1 Tax=Phytophthora palmivora TaxID=4796 RepID=A0A2P4WWW6_9STRA|nr:Pleiotropic drug resistance protein [Phytophthora palmivora]
MDSRNSGSVIEAPVVNAVADIVSAVSAETKEAVSSSFSATPLREPKVSTVSMSLAPERSPHATTDCVAMPTTTSSHKRRRGLLQDRETKNEDETGKYVSDCVLDGDPNLMKGGADECTGLNSDQDSNYQEKLEGDSDAASGGGAWFGDWDIGELSDEEEVEAETELPDSLCLSTARNKKSLKNAFYWVGVW